MEHAHSAENQKLALRFSETSQKVSRVLGLRNPEDRFRSIQWVTMPFTLDNPRFGVREATSDAVKAATLLVGEELQRLPPHVLEWVLWREAILELFCRSVRLVPEAADIGLYGGLKYGVKNRAHREYLQRIWESVSPPQYYGFYSYVPTGGFDLFDRALDGQFLQLVIPWLNTTFCNARCPLTTSSLTSALERWMFEFHHPLSRRELRLLATLCDQPSLSQDELAKRVGSSQASASRILRRLAEKHLLRVVRAIDLPLVGLHRISVTFRVPALNTVRVLQEVITRIRYALSFVELGQLVKCEFAIPFNRIRRVRSWVAELAANLGLPHPSVKSVQEQIHHRGFGLYYPERGGWPLDYESILDNVSRLIREEWTPLLPPVPSFRFSKHATAPVLKLRPEDFVYIQRVTGAFFLTDRIAPTEAREARLAGFRESEHMTYRRRVRFLEQAGLLSPPLSIGIFNIGLDAAISMLIESSYEKSTKVLSALQLLPEASCLVYDDGSAGAILLVPKPSAVAIETSLHDLLIDSGIPVTTMVSPAWNAYGWVSRLPVNPQNYDFERGTWIWTKDTLPAPRATDT
jgi:DNA-binding Lrp family transcriptional regulator